MLQRRQWLFAQLCSFTPTSGQSLELGLHKPDEAKGKKEKKKKEFGTTFHSGSANIIKRTGRLGVEGTGLPCAYSLLWQGETFSGCICT